MGFAAQALELDAGGGEVAGLVQQFAAQSKNLVGADNCGIGVPDTDRLGLGAGQCIRDGCGSGLRRLCSQAALQGRFVHIGWNDTKGEPGGFAAFCAGRDCPRPG